MAPVLPGSVSRGLTALVCICVLVCVLTVCTVRLLYSVFECIATVTLQSFTYIFSLLGYVKKWKYVISMTSTKVYFRQCELRLVKSYTWVGSLNLFQLDNYSGLVPTRIIGQCCHNVLNLSGKRLVQEDHSVESPSLIRMRLRIR